MYVYLNIFNAHLYIYTYIYNYILLKLLVHYFNEFIIIFLKCKNLIDVALKRDSDKMYLFEQNFNYI